MCQSTGDPHIFPFIGGKFDIHHEGVFTVMQHKSFIFQSKLTYCRPARAWSGGLSLKCNFGFAVQTSEGQVFETNGGIKHILHNGKKVHKRLSRFPGPAVVRIKRKKMKIRGVAGTIMPADREFTILTKDYYLKLLTMKEYSSFFLSLSRNGRKMFGHAPGICGGGGQHTYVRPPNMEASEDNQAKMRNGGRLFGYPCKKCVAGLGYVGALCNCHEFLVQPEQQLFHNKLKPGLWEKMGKPKLNQEKLLIASRKCLKFIVAAPAGRLAWGHPALRSMLLSSVNDCALDSLSGAAEGHRRFNRAELVTNVCEATKGLVSQRAPSKVLCSIVSKCGLKTRRCKRYNG